MVKELTARLSDIHLGIDISIARKISNWFSLGLNIKIESDESVERYKARLVSKGYSQEYHIDY